MSNIPTQLENPKGLHQRYHIQKIQRVFKGYNFLEEAIYENEPIKVDEGSEYFVMRLDEGGKDREHIKACRVGIHAYADAIQNHLPELAKDLKERYPLLS